MGWHDDRSFACDVHVKPMLVEPSRISTYAWVKVAMITYVAGHDRNACELVHLCVCHGMMHAMTELDTFEGNMRGIATRKTGPLR